MDSVKGFLISKALLKGDPSTASRPFRNVQGESVSLSINLICRFIKFFVLWRVLEQS